MPRAQVPIARTRKRTPIPDSAPTAEVPASKEPPIGAPHIPGQPKPRKDSPFVGDKVPNGETSGALGIPFNHLELESASEGHIKKDLHIDFYNLEGEWLKQASLYAYYAGAFGDAIFRRDRLKQKLEVYRANLEHEVRSNPARLGDVKVTEAAIAAFITENETIQIIQRELDQADRDVNLYNTCRVAMDQKKTSLEYLTRIMMLKWNVEKMGEAERARYEKAAERLRDKIEADRLHEEHLASLNPESAQPEGS